MASLEKPKNLSWRSWRKLETFWSKKHKQFECVARLWNWVTPQEWAQPGSCSEPSEEEAHICILRPQCEVSDQAFSCWSWFHVATQKKHLDYQLSLVGESLILRSHSHKCFPCGRFYVVTFFNRMKNEIVLVPPNIGLICGSTRWQSFCRKMTYLVLEGEHCEHKNFIICTFIHVYK